MRLISFIDGEHGYCTLVDGAEGAWCCGVGAGEPLRADSPSPPRRAAPTSTPMPGRSRSRGARPGRCSSSAERVARIYPVRRERLRSRGPLSGPGVAWDLPDGGWSAAPPVWAITAKSRLMVLVALRPEDSREHGEEVVGAARICPATIPRLRRAAALDRIRRGRRPHAGDARALVARTTPRRARRRPRIAGGATSTP